MQEGPVVTTVIIKAPPCALRSFFVSVPPAVQHGQLRRPSILQVQKHGFGGISDLAGRLFRVSSARTLTLALTVFRVLCEKVYPCLTVVASRRTLILCRSGSKADLQGHF